MANGGGGGSDASHMVSHGPPSPYRERCTASEVMALPTSLYWATQTWSSRTGTSKSYWMTMPRLSPPHVWKSTPALPSKA